MFARAPVCVWLRPAVFCCYLNQQHSFRCHTTVYIPDVSTPVALVATAEKGYQSVRIRVASRGGHSSMPPVDGSSVGDILGRVLSRLSAAPPAPRLVAPTTDMLRAVAAYAPGEACRRRGQLQKYLLGNRPFNYGRSPTPHLLSARAAWLSAILATIGVVPGADTIVAHIMASSSAEAASLVRGRGLWHVVLPMLLDHTLGSSWAE